MDEQRQTRIFLCHPEGPQAGYRYFARTRADQRVQPQVRLLLP